MVTEGKIARLFIAQKGLCFHCMDPMLMAPATKRSKRKYNDGWTREHIIPRSKGGQNGENVVLAHWRCNHGRGHADPTKDMLRRAASIWEIARVLDVKEVKRLTGDPAVIGTYVRAYNWSIGVGEPKYVPPGWFVKR